MAVKVTARNCPILPSNLVEEDQFFREQEFGMTACYQTLVALPDFRKQSTEELQMQHWQSSKQGAVGAKKVYEQYKQNQRADGAFNSACANWKIRNGFK